jgi:PAS domain S-box-containing protein
MCRIMVVDDEAIITSQMEDYLKMLGYDVAGIANSGEEAIDLAKKVHPDLILMDIVMRRNKIDGITTSEIIKKEFDIPVIFMTAYGGDKILERVKSAEPVGFIVKPFQENELKVAIEMALYRREMEKRLRESEEKYRSLVNAAADAIFTVDAAGNVVFWNQAAVNLFGYTPEEAVSHRFTRFLPQGDSATLTEEMQKIIHKKHSDLAGRTQESHGIRKDGGTFPLEFNWTSWKVRDGVFFTIIARDVTERKKIEQMKSDFVSLVSHQLKTPVAGIMGCIDNMLMGLTGGLTEKQKQYLEVMQEISSRNFRVITNLLNVSRIERGVVSVELKPWRLKDLVVLAVKGYREAIEKKKLHLKIEEPPGEVRVKADKDKLVEALINCIDNAVKFTDAGGITIRIHRTKAFGVVEIEDTGPGLSEQVLQALFTRERVLTGGPSVKEGCGLGLYTAREFVKLQNGRVSARSAPGKGSMFIFDIPLIDADVA